MSSLSRLMMAKNLRCVVRQRFIWIPLSDLSTSAIANGASRPAPALRQLKVPEHEKGHFKYERDWSRDGQYIAQKPGDTPSRVLLRRLGHAYEIYPILFLIGVWAVLFCGIVYISFDKIEVWVDRTSSKSPWAWERIRNNYWKQHTLTFDKEGVSHKRCLMMEQLQDEMLKAAKERAENSE
ncbi:unnamed protein product [Anisakis simplex]|uniref:Uncharacterized protein n=1 Tax=Anisakis simplex TaxID=6269 RepID=A0A0M3K8G7_ANISI|nr:unnamed protein product [Anisakis simplex]